MGEIADMILDGILCEVCGVVIDEDGDDVPGYTRACEGCKE